MITDSQFAADQDRADVAQPPVFLRLGVGAVAVVVDVGDLDHVNPPPGLAGHLQACGIDVHWDVAGISAGDVTINATAGQRSL